jgi:hypothetical protein
MGEDGFGEELVGTFRQARSWPKPVEGLSLHSKSGLVDPELQNIGGCMSTDDS